MNRAELAIQKIANEHSYADWGELMYDTHPHSQVEYTLEAMKEIAWQAWKELWDRIFNNLNAISATTESSIDENACRVSFEKWLSEQVEPERGKE